MSLRRMEIKKKLLYILKKTVLQVILQHASTNWHFALTVDALWWRL